jgi:NAD(P)-dependent dehydrogenase (short-subunit alcohol dehydrogenase family)
MKDLFGKTAVITGAASGFGREIARACAIEGMKLVLADVDRAGAEATAQLPDLRGADVLVEHCDVAQAADVERLADAAYGRFGAVHLMFNNAGVMTVGPVWSAPPQDWEWVFGVNVMGVVNGVHAFVPRMLKQGGDGHVVNTSSLAGMVSPSGMGVYSASKFAVVAISEALYHDLKRAKASIGVSVLCPAFVATGIADAERNRPPRLEADNPDAAPLVAQLRTALHAGRLTAADIARSALDAVKNDRFYVFPHERAKVGIARRFEDILAGREPTDPMG